MNIGCASASSETKDCLQLLTLLGVPVIQVEPIKHTLCSNVYVFMLSLVLSPSPSNCTFLAPSLHLCLVLQAPGDAEALCAWLVRAGTVDAVASEDMDTLPFGGSILIRQLNAKKNR